MKKIKKLISLGGDNRQNYMLRRFKEFGYDAESSDTVPENINDFDAVILPLPASSDSVHIKGTNIKFDDLCDCLLPQKIIFTGKIDETTKAEFFKKGISVYDYYAREEFAQKNAVPTAQGVLTFVMNHLPKTVCSLKVTVIGYGKSGKAICKMFSALGADVTSCSRKYLSVATAQAHGFRSFLLKDAAKAAEYSDIVINTVPATILGKEFIDKVPKEAMLIDISSPPYGFDLSYAESAGRKVCILPSLPGHYVPATAGSIIADTILNILEEAGL